MVCSSVLCIGHQKYCYIWSDLTRNILAFKIETLLNPNQNLMKKIVFSLVFILAAISGFSQVDEPTITFGVNSGIDFNHNAYQFRGFQGEGVKYTYYGIDRQYNMGINAGIILNKKMRLRAELKYVNGSYGINYDTTQNNTLIHTVWNVNNMDFNVYFDYLLVKYKKLDVFGSFGIKYEYYTGQYIHNDVTKKDPDSGIIGHFTDSEHYKPVKIAYPTSILGSSLSLLFKYNITKHIGITLTPEYTMFYRNYVKTNSKSYSRISADAGFEFQF